jgi:hypothetical protein
VRRRTGTVNLRLDLTTIGASGTNYDFGGGYLGALLGAGFESLVAGSGSDSITAISDVNTFTPTSSANYLHGGIIGVEVNGRAEYSAVTDADVAGEVTVSPAFSSGFTGTATARLMQSWVPGQRTNLGNTLYSVSFRVDGVGFRSYAYGCVLESMQLSLDNGRVMADLTY